MPQLILFGLLMSVIFFHYLSKIICLLHMESTGPMENKAESWPWFWDVELELNTETHGLGGS